MSSVVVDDHMIFREGLRALLGRVDDIEIVGEAATTQEAIEIAEAARPDVVLMDLHLPGNRGEAATTTILAYHPEIAVLVLTIRPTCATRCTQAPVATYSRTPNRTAPPTARRPSPSPVTLEWVAVPNLPGLRDAQ